MTGHMHGAPPVEPSPPVPSWRLLATLALAGGLAGGLIVFAYASTLPRIEAHKAELVVSAVREVLKAPARWDTLYLVDGTLTKTAPTGNAAKTAERAFLGYDGVGAMVGAAVTAAEPGFQDVISLIYGIDPTTGTLLGMKVLDRHRNAGTRQQDRTARVPGPVRRGADTGAGREEQGKRPGRGADHHRRHHFLARGDPDHQQFGGQVAAAVAGVSQGRSAVSAAPPASFDDVLRGIWRENPVLIQMLGLCPTLAVTNSVANGLVMSMATIFVLIGSNVLVASLKRFIPDEVRITSYVMIIATFVTVADLLLSAYTPTVHKQLGAFVALIVVNCIILGRAEAFAAKNTVRRSFLDAIGMGAGFTLTLVTMSAIRELLGTGSLLGHRVFGTHYEPWVIMVLPPGGFLTLGFIMLGLAWYADRKKRRARMATASAGLREAA